MLIYHKKDNSLRWGKDHYHAVSGPYGLGPLPDGYYDVLTRHVVTGRMDAPYQDPKTGLAFFIPIQPLFDTSRSGFGIHPDGNTPGTLGCIGLTDSSAFWAKWNETPLPNRPNLLHVESRVMDLDKMEPYERISFKKMPIDTTKMWSR